MYICNEFILQWEEGNRKAMVLCDRRFLFVYVYDKKFFGNTKALFESLSSNQIVY